MQSIVGFISNCVELFGDRDDLALAVGSIAPFGLLLLCYSGLAVRSGGGRGGRRGGNGGEAGACATIATRES